MKRSAVVNGKFLNIRDRRALTTCLLRALDIIWKKYNDENKTKEQEEENKLESIEDAKNFRINKMALEQLEKMSVEERKELDVECARRMLQYPNTVVNKHTLWFMGLSVLGEQIAKKLKGEQE